MEISSYMPLVSPHTVVVSRNSVTPVHISGAKQTQSPHSNVGQGFAPSDIRVTSGLNVDAIPREACLEVLGGSGTEAHIVGQADVGESVVGAHITVQNEVSPQLHDGVFVL
ncbi:hypothetical protein V6N11_067270 [Hibiscus sabdariffa]|uniref:Uncharacterized protein n=1 Tax=Hibiscus sabdariffa TaxID=183260 RepID=A0ABR2SQK7_9ROSI